jgi:hypothetical protein
MNGVVTASTTSLQTITDQNWKLQSISSFNGDPISDIIWRNYQTGQTAAWIIGGGQVGNTVYLPTEADMNWEIVGPR